ncbi:MAG: aspartate kinase [Saezia sp.]
MALIVQKYGGTSMGSVERITSVAKRVAKWARAGHRVVVVPSAMSGETNRLLGLANEIMAGITVKNHKLLREQDAIAATGEQVSVGLLSMALQVQGQDAVSFAGWQVPIQTDSAYTNARIVKIDAGRVHKELDTGKVVIITGFQGICPEGNVTTLGRGGSDTSAVAIAAALKADECLIFTDVDGIYTTDPRVVPEARRMNTISFEEILELASLGSKVLQIRSVEFAGRFRVPTRVLSSLTPWDLPIAEEIKSGTLITYEEDQMENAIVSGIAFSRDEAKISVLKVPDQPGNAYRILGAVSDANIEVDMIIQNLSHDGYTDFSFTVSLKDYDATMLLLKDKVLPQLGKGATVEGDTKISKVSIVGSGMRNHAGVASTMFKTLFDESINIQMITTSEIKTSVVIDEKYMELAVRALHKAFNLGLEKIKE